MTHTKISLPLAVAVLWLLALPMAVGAAEEDELAAAREATAVYQDVSAAETEGYGLPSGVPLEHCIASLDDTGAMGLHYINGDLVGEAVLDPATPEALVYEPAGDGTLSLVALEYVVFAEAWDAENESAPVLFEQEFMFVAEPNRYELPAFYALHVWLWKDNPSGLYANFNPDVTCPMPSTSVTARPGSPLVVAAGIGLVLTALGVGLARRSVGRVPD